MTRERVAFLLGLPLGLAATVWAVVAPAYRPKPVLPRRSRGDLLSASPRALAWRCDRCFGRLTVRLDNQPPPTRCEGCGGDLLEPFPLRSKTDKPEAP